MALYDIAGQQFEIPDDVQGDQLVETLTQLSETVQKPTLGSGVEDPSAQGGAPIAGRRLTGVQRHQQSEQELQTARAESERTGIPLARDIEEIGSSPQLSELSSAGFLSSMGSMFSFSDEEVGNILQEQFPGTEINKDAEGLLIAKFPDGSDFAINKKGLGGQDIARLFGAIGQALPATKIATLGTAGLRATPRVLAQRAAQAAPVAAGTQAGVELGQEQIGGTFDVQDVAIAGAAPIILGTAGGIGKGAINKVVGTGTPKQISDRTINQALKESAPTIEGLKGESRAVFNQIDDLGVSIKPEAFESIPLRLMSLAKREGFNKRIHPKVSAALDEFESSIGKSPTVSEVDTLRRVMQSAAKSIEPDEARIGRAMLDEVDSFLDNLAPSALRTGKENANQVGVLYKDARQLWGRAKRAEVMQTAVELAKDQASGFENGLRTQFRSILGRIKRGKLKGFSKDEIAAMDRVVKGDTAENTAKFLGKFGLSEGHATSMLGAAVGIAGGAAVGGPIGAVVVPGVGQVAKGLAQRMTRGNAEFASAITRAGKDGRKVALEYFRNTPAKQRSTEELTQLLMRPDISLKGLQKMASGSAKPQKKFIKDAIFFIENMSNDDLARSLGIAATGEAIRDGLGE